jgi:RNA polymerase sigma-70 factor (ECF subfamily)
MATSQVTRETLHLELAPRVQRLRLYLSRHIPASLRRTLTADDLLQEVWAAAFRTVGHFRSNGTDAIDRWLTTLARAKLVDAVRSARCLKRGGNWRYTRSLTPRLSSFGGVLFWLRSPQRTPSQTAHLADTAQRILIALEQLSDRQRRAVELRYLAGLSRQKIAQELDSTEKAVKALLERGLQQMREALGPAAKYFTDARSSDEAQKHAQS